MPRVINEDAYSQVIETDDGRVVFVPKGAVDAPAAPATQVPPAPEPPPPPAPSMGMPAPVSAALPGAVTSQLDVAPNLAAPAPVAAPAPAPEQPAPADAPPPAKTAPAPKALKAPSTTDAYQQQQGALGDMAQATVDEATVNKLIADEQYGLMDRGAQTQDAMEAQRARAVQERAKEHARLQSDADASAKDYESTTIDEDRRWHDASTGKKVLWGISMALAGLGQALNHKAGEPNPVIGMLDQWIAADVRQQQDARAQKGRAAERKAEDVTRWEKLSADQEAQFNARMSGEMAKTARQVEMVAAKYKGTQGEVNAQKAVAELRAKGAEYAAKYAESEADRAMQRKQIGLGYANLKEGARQFDARSAEDKRQFDAQLATKIGQDAFDNAIKIQTAAGVAGSAAQKFAQESADKAKARAIYGVPKVTIGANGQPVVSRDVLRNRDGSVYQAPTDPDGKALQDSKAVTDEVVQLLDDTIRLREQFGTEADMIRSPAWRKMQSNWARIALKAKEGDKLGALSGSDLELEAKQIGTADPTELRDVISGLRQYRGNILNGFNTVLVNKGYDGDPYSIPELTGAGAMDAVRNTPAQEDLAQASNPHRADRGLMGAGRGNSTTAADWNEFLADPKGYGAKYQGEAPLAPAQKTAATNLALKAKEGDAGAVRALSAMALGSPSPRLRLLAQELAAANGIQLEGAR